MRLSPVSFLTLLTAAVVFASCGPGEPSPEPLSQVRLAYGEPQGDFPTYDERVTLVEINRVRADPNNVAAFTAGDCSPHRDPVPPVSYDLDLAEAARFFASYIDQSGCPLGHNARCTLRSDLDGAGCDGTAACACEPGSDCGSCGCGTGPQQRPAIFGFTGGSIRENGASGHSVPQYAVWDWAMECGSAPHRMTLTAPEVNVVGTGTHAPNATRFADFGSLPGWQTPRIPAASHYDCEWTQVSAYSYSCVPQVLFRANYYDTSGDPQSMHVVVDGVCIAMEAELGSAGNRTYRVAPDAFAAGCHEYYFVAVDQAGSATSYPDVGSLTFGTCADGYVDGQLASSCSQGTGGGAGAGGSGSGGTGTAGSAGGGGAAGSGGVGGAGAGGTSSGTGGAGAAGSGGVGAAAGSSGATGNPDWSADDPSSCACSSPGRRASTGSGLVALLALAAVRRRRR